MLGRIEGEPRGQCGQSRWEGARGEVEGELPQAVGSRACGPGEATAR